MTVRVFRVSFPSVEFTVIFLLSKVPVGLVVFGTPITVGLVPVGGHGLAGRSEQDRSHKNA